VKQEDCGRSSETGFTIEDVFAGAEGEELGHGCVGGHGGCTGMIVN
jgi:hypothetical protein